MYSPCPLEAQLMYSECVYYKLLHRSELFQIFQTELRIFISIDLLV